MNKMKSKRFQSNNDDEHDRAMAHRGSIRNLHDVPPLDLAMSDGILSRRSFYKSPSHPTRSVARRASASPVLPSSPLFPATSSRNRASSHDYRPGAKPRTVSSRPRAMSHDSGLPLCIEPEDRGKRRRAQQRPERGQFPDSSGELDSNEIDLEAREEDDEYTSSSYSSSELSCDFGSSGSSEECDLETPSGDTLRCSGRHVTWQEYSDHNRLSPIPGSPSFSCSSRPSPSASSSPRLDLASTPTATPISSPAVSQHRNHTSDMSPPSIYTKTPKNASLSSPSSYRRLSNLLRKSPSLVSDRATATEPVSESLPSIGTPIAPSSKSPSKIISFSSPSSIRRLSSFLLKSSSSGAPNNEVAAEATSQSVPPTHNPAADPSIHFDIEAMHKEDSPQYLHHNTLINENSETNQGNKAITQETSSHAITNNSNQHHRVSGSMITTSSSGSLGDGDLCSSHSSSSSHSSLEPAPEMEQTNRTKSVASHWSAASHPPTKQHARNLNPYINPYHSRLPKIKRPSLSSDDLLPRLSDRVARHAPCFYLCLCCCLPSLGASFATDRQIHRRLNILLFIFALVQISSAMLLTILLLGNVANVATTEQDEQLERKSLTPNLWNLTGYVYALGTEAILLLGTALYGHCIHKSETNILGALRYLWALVWLLPFELFLVIGLFDYHRVVDVWIKHWWTTPSMAWFRELFCASGTAHEQCLSPLIDATEWCLRKYGETNCSDVRKEAEAQMKGASYTYYTMNGVWGLLLCVVMILAMNIQHGILTKPIVQKSKEGNVPLWLTFPAVGCFATGAVLLFSPSSAAQNDFSRQVLWIGRAYLASGFTFTFATFNGMIMSCYSVYNSRSKKRKEVLVLIFLFIMLFTLVCVGAVFGTSLLYSVNLWHIDLDYGEIACMIDTAGTCSNCGQYDVGQLAFENLFEPQGDDGGSGGSGGSGGGGGNGEYERDQCPEWSNEDVDKVLRTQLKSSAALAAIFFIYALSAIQFGFALWNHVKRYQIEYV